MTLLTRLRSRIQRQRFPIRYRELDRLLKSQRLSTATLQQQQQQQLQQIVTHAAEQVPFYQTRLSEWDGTLVSLPILTKQEVQHHLDDLLSSTHDPAHTKVGYTGGSTGAPVAYYYDEEKIEKMRGGQYRSFMQCGWQPGDRVLQLWGAAQDLSSTSLLARWIAAEETVAAAIFDEATLHYWYQRLIQYRPSVVRGYPSILAALANFMIDQQLPPPSTLLGCFSTAEVLYPHQRSNIEQALECKVYNQYGSREIPNISCECAHGNQHIFTDLVAVESVEQEGEPQLLITSLTNRLMPMIRYQIGDLGRLLDEPCSCGSPFPLMEMEVCRSNDLIQAPNGRQIYPSWLIHLLDEIEGIEQFQFHQPSQERLLLQFIAEGEHPLDPALLEQKIHAEMGAAMQLSVEQVKEIPRNRSGKHRFVSSDL